MYSLRLDKVNQNKKIQFQINFILFFLKMYIILKKSSYNHLFNKMDYNKQLFN